MIPVVVATAAALGLASGTHCTLMCGPLVGGACTSKGAVDRGEAVRYLLAPTAASAALRALAMLVFSLASAPFLVAALLVGDRAARWVRSQRRATRAIGLALTCAMAVAMVMLPVVVAAKRNASPPAHAP